MLSQIKRELSHLVGVCERDRKCVCVGRPSHFNSELWFNRFNLILTIYLWPTSALKPQEYTEKIRDDPPYSDGSHPIHIPNGKSNFLPVVLWHAYCSADLINTWIICKLKLFCANVMPNTTKHNNIITLQGNAQRDFGSYFYFWGSIISWFWLIVFVVWDKRDFLL